MDSGKAADGVREGDGGVKEPPPIWVIVLAAVLAVATAVHAAQNAIFLFANRTIEWPGHNKAMFTGFVITEGLISAFSAFCVRYLLNKRRAP
jgi:hypothetical protein